MKNVLSRKDLQHETEHWVMVQREDCIYVRIGDEYVRKRYFSPKEVQEIMEIRKHEVYELIDKLQLRTPHRKAQVIRLTLKDVRMMINHKSHEN